MDEIYQCFVVVDENGNIISAQQGKNIIATDPYDFGFLNDGEIEISEWKVVIEKMKPKLVSREGGDAE
ncbi:hypothetical protein [Planomicrobium okeanokoites]|uniref:Uncharacterized protein n=1 Tax=Planomicrobium okeanokoites TaxID=244 RepID=A0ABV7KU19_PLAOK|nr:hypothetical protein [Planomicrobium okeanokoites]TAA71588.1 hypothetical protein D2910_04735 [Planomicrobium okeanokoites]